MDWQRDGETDPKEIGNSEKCKMEVYNTIP